MFSTSTMVESGLVSKGFQNIYTKVATKHPFIQEVKSYNFFLLLGGFQTFMSLQTFVVIFQVQTRI
jgi:hypothetical protein